MTRAARALLRQSHADAAGWRCEGCGALPNRSGLCLTTRNRRPLNGQPEQAVVMCRACLCVHWQSARLARIRQAKREAAGQLRLVLPTSG